MKRWTLDGKVVLITGGARGIGAATAAELVRRGARPVLTDIDAEALAGTAAGIAPAPLTIELDVTSMEGCEAAVQRTLAEHGRLDMVWANAGIGSTGPLWMTAPAVYERTLEVNLLGTYNTIRAALPAVMGRQGYVAATASIASFIHAPGVSAYSAAKAGVEAMCNALRLEVAHLGVDVGTIHPGYIDTDMLNEVEAQSPWFGKLRMMLPPPIGRIHPAERAALDIAGGFERRSRRVCTPRSVKFAHWWRTAATTRPFEHRMRTAAPEVLSAFEEGAAQGGTEGASVSERVAAQLGSRRAQG